MRLKFLSECSKAVSALAGGVALVSVLSGCSTTGEAENAYGSKIANDTKVTSQTGFDRVISWLSPYRMPIQQGNFVSQEMVAQLKEGMTREEVTNLLGTALLTDVFHEDRWDYPFRLRKSNGDLITSNLTIYFKNNTVEKFVGGDLPAEKAYLEMISNAAIKGFIASTPTDPAAKKDSK
jgi:outer membrane protein assembly factor BamE